MHVLVAHSRYSADPNTGENVHVEREATALERAGVTVTRYLPSSGDQSAATLAMRSLWSRAAARDIRELIAERRPDVVHVHNVQPMLSPAVASAAHRAGVPVVQTVHNYRFRCLPANNYRDGHICHDCRPANLFVPGIVHRCYRDSAAGSAVAALGQLPARSARRHVRRWLAISEHVRRRMVADGFPERDVVVHHNFCPDPGAGVDAAARTDEVLYAGKLTPDKGVPLLLAAMAAVPDAAVRLLVAGRGVLEPEVRAAAVRDARITYLGGVALDELNEIRKRCAAAVVPSLWEEPFGLTAIEAMASGTPVVTTGTGGLAELVDESNGWLVASDASALGEAMAAAVAEGAARGAAARARYLAGFTEPAAIARLRAIYDAVTEAA